MGGAASTLTGHAPAETLVRRALDAPLPPWRGAPPPRGVPDDEQCTAAGAETTALVRAALRAVGVADPEAFNVHVFRDRRGAYGAAGAAPKRPGGIAYANGVILRPGGSPAYTVYVAFHEAAHIRLGHTAGGRRRAHNSFVREIEADALAFRALFRAGYGALALRCARSQWGLRVYDRPRLRASFDGGRACAIAAYPTHDERRNYLAAIVDHELSACLARPARAATLRDHWAAAAWAAGWRESDLTPALLCAAFVVAAAVAHRGAPAPRRRPLPRGLPPRFAAAIAAGGLVLYGGLAARGALARAAEQHRYLVEMARRGLLATGEAPPGAKSAESAG